MKPKKKGAPDHALVNTPGAKLPGPTLGKAKRGQQQKAVSMPAHKTGGLKGSTRAKPKPPKPPMGA